MLCIQCILYTCGGYVRAAPVYCTGHQRCAVFISSITDTNNLLVTYAQRTQNANILLFLVYILCTDDQHRTMMINDSRLGEVGNCPQKCSLPKRSIRLAACPIRPYHTIYTSSYARAHQMLAGIFFLSIRNLWNRKQQRISRNMNILCRTEQIIRHKLAPIDTS